LSSAGSGEAIDERTFSATTAPAVGQALATFELATSDSLGFVTVDVTDYLKSLTVTPATLVTFAISQNTPNDKTHVAFDSKESLTTSHGASLEIALTGSEIGHLEGTPAQPNTVVGGGYQFLSTLAGVTLKAGQSVVVIADLILSSSGTSSFDLSVAEQPSDSLAAPIPVSNAQHYDMPAAFGPQSFSRNQVFTATVDGTYTVGVAVNPNSGASVQTSGISDISIIPLQ
jgi:hypothetical protein